MEPTKKNPEIEEVLTDLVGISRQDAADQQICTWCKQPLAFHPFKDELSKKEWTISGMCQKCQDEVWPQEEL